MQLIVLNDLAEAKRRRTEKNGVLIQVFWQSLYLSVFVRAMLFDVLVLLLLVLLCGLL